MRRQLFFFGRRCDGYPGIPQMLLQRHFYLGGKRAAVLFPEFGRSRKEVIIKI